MNKDELWEGLHDEIVEMCSKFITARGRISKQPGAYAYQGSNHDSVMD
jgi:hypothetical protein